MTRKNSVSDFRDVFCQTKFGSKHLWLQSCGHLRSLGSSRLIFLKLLAVAQSFVFLGIGDQPSFVSWLWEFPQGDLLRRSCVNSCAAMLPCSIPPWMGLRFSTQHSLKTIKSSMYGSSCGSVPKPFAFLKGLSKSGPLRWMCWFQDFQTPPALSALDWWEWPVVCWFLRQFAWRDGKLWMITEKVLRIFRSLLRFYVKVCIPV